MKKLISKNFSISYTKSKYKKMEDGAAFLFEGKLLTPEDREAVSKFMAEALGAPSMAKHFHYVDSRGALADEPFDSGHLDRNWDYYFPDEIPPGFSEPD